MMRSYDMDLDYVDLYDKEFGNKVTITGSFDRLIIPYKFKMAQLNLQANLNYKYTCDCYTTGMELRLILGVRLSILSI